MPTLLELPRELRDKILSLVLSHHTPAPQDISDTSNRAEFGDVSFSWPEGRNVLYIEHPKMRDSTSLLLLNRQLHKETLETIQRLPSKHSYVLDVIIAEESKLWPTWLYAPVLTTRVDQVYAAIRTIGCHKKGFGLFEGGGPYVITYAFWNLVNRFLKVGPVGRRTKKDDKRISLKELIVDIHTPDVPANKILPRMHSDSFAAQIYRKENGPDFLRHPEYILNYVISDFGSILAMSSHSAPYGALVYERVGSIKVLMDGEVRKEWDLATCLAELQFNNSFGNYPREQRQQVFAKWKLKAHQTRVEFGLPVIPVVKEGKGKGKRPSSG